MQTPVRQIAQMTHSLSLSEKAELVKMIMADIQSIMKNSFFSGKGMVSAADCRHDTSDDKQNYSAHNNGNIIDRLLESPVKSGTSVP